MSQAAFDEMAAQLDHMAEQLDAPPPMRQMESAEEVAARRAKKQRELKKATAVRAAGGVARERLSQRSGPQRSTLFDGDDWREQTGARSAAMEATLSHLYKPTTGAYWTAQRNGTQPPVRRDRLDRAGPAEPGGVAAERPEHGRRSVRERADHREGRGARVARTARAPRRRK